MENTPQESSSLPYSYHTFLLAFNFDCGFSYKEGKHGRWVDDSLRKGTDEELRLNYQMYQYFTPEARNLMFNENRIKRLRYDIPGDRDREYIIKKTIEEDEKDDKGNKTEKKSG
ncbi:MAG: hypothetical protein IJ598_11885 [Ruminococcus sp.]|nr:hypothetical protein [Ruminococcus sp.]